jgi:hypothetical protein
MFAGQAHRDGVDGAQIGGDIFTVEPSPRVAPRTNRPSSIVQRNRQAIEFRFDGIFDDIGSRASPSRTRRSNAATSSSEKALPSDSMGSVCANPENASRVEPRPAGSANQRSAVPDGRFEFLQFAQQAVVFGIRQGRRVENVIAVIGLVDQRAQLRLTAGRLIEIRRIPGIGLCRCPV